MSLENLVVYLRRCPDTKDVPPGKRKIKDFRYFTAAEFLRHSVFSGHVRKVHSKFINQLDGRCFKITNYTGPKRKFKSSGT